MIIPHVNPIQHEPYYPSMPRAAIEEQWPGARYLGDVQVKSFNVATEEEQWSKQPLAWWFTEGVEGRFAGMCTGDTHADVTANWRTVFTNSEDVLNVSGIFNVHDGLFLWSRYGHDMVQDTRTGTFIDGGQERPRYNMLPSEESWREATYNLHTGVLVFD